MNRDGTMASNVAFSSAIDVLRFDSVNVVLNLLLLHTKMGD